MTTPTRAFQFGFALHLRNWLNMKLWPFPADVGVHSAVVRTLSYADTASSAGMSSDKTRMIRSGRAVVPLGSPRPAWSCQTA